MSSNLHSVRRARLDLAVEKLSEFEGDRASPLDQTAAADKAAGSVPAPSIKKARKPRPPKKIAREFLRHGEVVETVGRLVDKCKDGLGEDIGKYNELGIIVIPDSSASKSLGNVNILNDSKISVKNTDQGIHKGANGPNTYTFHDDLVARGKDKKGKVLPAGTPDDALPELHIIQVMDPTQTPSSTNTDVVSTALNLIPGIEYSKAVPYLNIEFLSSNSDKKSSSKGSKTRGITTSRQLLGKLVDPKYIDFFKADFLGSETDEPSFETLSGMDVFCSPQTLVPLDAFGQQKKSFKDPFRPLLSIDSFVLRAESPKYGLDPTACDVTATIELILHDRSRLQDIRELVTPGGFSADGKMRITYGYAHPDGTTSRSSDAHKSHSLFGDVVDGLRMTELFNVFSSEFSMTEDGEVKITVSAMSGAAGTTFTSIGVTDAWSDSSKFSKVINDLKELRFLVQELSARDNLKKITVPTVLKVGGSSQSLPNVGIKTTAALQKYLQAVKAKTQSGDGKDLFEKVNALTTDLFMKFGNSITTQSNTRAASLDKIFTYLRNSPDPFGRPMLTGTPSVTNIVPKRGFSADQHSPKGGPGVGTNKSHITLGKALAVLIGGSMKKAYAGKGVDEIQMIFHGFNESAGGVQDYNIASFPIVFEQFKTVIEKAFKKRLNLSLDQLIQILNEEFLAKQSSPAYGVANFPKTLTQQACINEMYGIDKAFPYSEFRVPKLSITSRTFSATDDGRTNTKNVVRLEIFDARCGNLSAPRRLLDAGARDGFFYNIQRQTQKTPAGKHSSGMRHAHHISEAEKVLEPYLKKIDAKVIDDAKKASQLNDASVKILDSIKDNVHIVTLTKQGSLDLLKETFPSLVYGSAATGIMSADISSYKDEGAVELAIARENTALGRAKLEHKQETGIVAEVYPVKCKLTTLGNPYFNFSQQFFIDFGTGTSIDNIYGVTSVEHSLSAGEFKSDVELVQEDTYPVLITPTGEIGNLLVASLLKLN